MNDDPKELLDPKDRRPENRLSAYYYSFDATGCQEIDDVLEAVALAGKMYHSTADWCYDADNPQRESPDECIERIAKRSAAEVLLLRARVAELEAELMAAHGDPDDHGADCDTCGQWTHAPIQGQCRACRYDEDPDEDLDDNLTDGGSDE